MFSPGDRVFAKMKGFPFWPARVDPLPPHVEAPKGKIPVFFYGTHQVSFLSPKNLVSFEDHKDMYGKRKVLIKAMNEIESDPEVLLLGKDPAAEAFWEALYPLGHCKIDSDADKNSLKSSRSSSPPKKVTKRKTPKTPRHHSEKRQQSGYHEDDTNSPFSISDIEEKALPQESELKEENHPNCQEGGLEKQLLYEVPDKPIYGERPQSSSDGGELIRKGEHMTKSEIDIGLENVKDSSLERRDCISPGEIGGDMSFEYSLYAARNNEMHTLSIDGSRNANESLRNDPDETLELSHFSAANTEPLVNIEPCDMGKAFKPIVESKKSRDYMRKRKFKPCIVDLDDEWADEEGYFHGEKRNDDGKKSEDPQLEEGGAPEEYTLTDDNERVLSENMDEESSDVSATTVRRKCSLSGGDTLASSVGEPEIQQPAATDALREQIVAKEQQINSAILESEGSESAEASEYFSAQAKWSSEKDDRDFRARNTTQPSGHENEHKHIKRRRSSAERRGSAKRQRRASPPSRGSSPSGADKLQVLHDLSVQLKVNLVRGHEDFGAAVHVLERICATKVSLLQLTQVWELTDCVKKCRKYRLSVEVRDAASRALAHFQRIQAAASKEEVMKAQAMVAERLRREKSLKPSPQPAAPAPLVSSPPAPAVSTSDSPVANCSPDQQEDKKKFSLEALRAELDAKADLLLARLAATEARLMADRNKNVASPAVLPSSSASRKGVEETANDVLSRVDQVASRLGVDLDNAPPPPPPPPPPSRFALPKQVDLDTRISQLMMGVITPTSQPQSAPRAAQQLTTPPSKLLALREQIQRRRRSAAATKTSTSAAQKEAVKKTADDDIYDLLGV